MKSGNETMLIQLEENYFLETLLLRKATKKYMLNEEGTF